MMGRSGCNVILKLFYLALMQGVILEMTLT